MSDPDTIIGELRDLLDKEPGLAGVAPPPPRLTELR